MPWQLASPGPQPRSARGDGPPARKGSAPVRCCRRSPSCALPTAGVRCWLGPPEGDIFMLFGRRSDPRGWYLTYPGDKRVFFYICFGITGGGFLWCGGI